MTMSYCVLKLCKYYIDRLDILSNYNTNSLGSLKFVKFRGRRSLTGQSLLYVRFVLRQSDIFIGILWRDARLSTWGFSKILLKIWSEPSILGVNIIRCTAL